MVGHSEALLTEDILETKEVKMQEVVNTKKIN